MEKETLEFLSRILNKPGFRALAEKDPVKAMKEVGYNVPPAELANVPKPATLPSDEEVRALLVLAKHWDNLEEYNYVWFFICGWPKPPKKP